MMKVIETKLDPLVKVEGQVETKLPQKEVDGPMAKVFDTKMEPLTKVEKEK